MKTKNKVLLVLLAIAVLSFCVIKFYIVPEREKQQIVYVTQQDAITHDIKTIKDYKSPYIGNASNVGNLFDRLPLSDTGRKYEIDSNKCTLTVYYLDHIIDIGESTVQQDLLYNTVAAMASIDNLAGITYKFYDKEFSFTREQIENIYGDNLSSLLDEKIWKEKVQDNITDTSILEKFYS